jgi:hypothetical protein
MQRCPDSRTGVAPVAQQQAQEHLQEQSSSAGKLFLHLFLHLIRNLRQFAFAVWVQVSFRVVESLKFSSLGLTDAISFASTLG